MDKRSVSICIKVGKDVFHGPLEEILQNLVQLLSLLLDITWNISKGSWNAKSPSNRPASAHLPNDLYLLLSYSFLNFASERISTLLSPSPPSLPESSP